MSVDPEVVAAEKRAEEAKLISALRRGDQSVAPLFFQKVGKAVRGTLFQVLGPGDCDHDDLFQVALERVVVSIMREKFVGRCSLATWSSVIASRVAIDALRRRRNERRIFAFRKDDEDEEYEVPAADTVRPDRQAADRTELKAIRRALGRISPDKAEAVVLFEVMGHDLNEIAEMTGVSVAAAQSRLVRGRKELASKLRKERGVFDVS
jgi:RNA polymerase sigma-70 factor (ECF subfamily)